MNFFPWPWNQTTEQKKSIFFSRWLSDNFYEIKMLFIFSRKWFKWKWILWENRFWQDQKTNDFRFPDIFPISLFSYQFIHRRFNVSNAKQRDNLSHTISDVTELRFQCSFCLWQCAFPLSFHFSFSFLLCIYEQYETDCAQNLCISIVNRNCQIVSC